MIRNKQVNLWRGPDPPPTLYHIWLKDENKLLRYDEELGDWVVFLDSGNIVKMISEFMESLDNILTSSINGYPIRDNPVLEAKDLLIGIDGNYFKKTNNIREVAKTFDTLMTTKVYGQ